MQTPSTQKQLEDIIWRVTILILGLDPDDTKEAVQKRVRISWPKDDGNSTWERNENVIFLRISPSPDDYTLQMEPVHEYDSKEDTLTEVVDYHRCFSVSWVCYGPDSLDDSDKIKHGIFSGTIKELLLQNGIAFIPNVREPVRLAELDDSGDWYERYDLTAQFYQRAQRCYEEAYIHQPPEVTINN